MSRPKSIWTQFKNHIKKMSLQATSGVIERPITFESDRLGPIPSLGDLGLRSKRWMIYVDNYLRGGPSFKKFLSKGGTYYFHGNHQHTKGPCIVSITVNKNTIILKSRVCDLLPTGILELNLIKLVSEHFPNRDFIWEIKTSRITDWQVVAYKPIMDLLPDSLFRDKVNWQLTRPIDEIKFMRAVRMRHYRFFSYSSDEEDVIRNFCRITSEDLSDITGVRREVIQRFLRKNYGWYAFGDGCRSYSWGSYQDPVLEAVAERFNIDLDSLPSFKKVIKRRIGID